jgi:hypothetical protein
MGTIDISFSILDEEGKDVHKFSRIDRYSTGIQVASTSVHGILKIIAPKAATLKKVP